MKVKEEQFELRMPRDPNRSPGLHLSDILRNLAFATGILDAKYRIPIEESNTMMMQLGLSWENYLAAHQHPEIMFHPKELMLDGIAMSPDGYSIADNEDYADALRVETGSYILHEFKLTKKSCRDFRDNLRLQSKKTLLWLWQIKAYRYALNKMLEAQGETPNGVAKLHVLFTNGNYSFKDDDPESFPTYKVYVLEFTPEELEENWAMIVGHSKNMEQEKAA